MPRYQNLTYVCSITYMAVKPAIGAIYQDSNSIQFTVLDYNFAQFVITGSQAPALGSLTNISGAGDAAVILTASVGQDVTVGDLRIPAGGYKDTNVWIPNYAALGLAQSAVIPAYSPVILSQPISSTQVVAVPASVLGNYRVTIVAMVAPVTLLFNSASGGTPYVLPAGQKIVKECTARTINDISFTITGGAIAYLTIEEAT